ncbi:MAG: cupin domain-containing protein [Bacteroidetes bacterium]|nr:cupin domain-containing protein [Bacteroidota bacterium]
MRPTAAYWIEKLQLEKHIEGGSYNQTWRSALIIPKTALTSSYQGDRPSGTAIYFLLEQGQFSAMHRIASDELWHFYYGDALIVYDIDEKGVLTEHLLGSNPEKGESFQCLVKAGHWFGARLRNGGEYALVGCTVSPGFDFSDFELAFRAPLTEQYPQHKDLIASLTRQ